MRPTTDTEHAAIWNSLPVWGLFIIAFTAALYMAQTILIPITLAFLFALVLSPITRVLQRWRIPQSLSGLLVLAIFLGSLSILANSLVDPAGKWIERIPDSTRLLEKKFKNLKTSLEEVRSTTEKLDGMTSVGETIDKKQQVVIRKPSLGSLLLESTQSLLIGLLSFAVLLYFFLAHGDSLLLSISKIDQKWNADKRALRITEMIRCDVSHYLFVITLINIFLGIITALVMYALDMPTPILWGTMACILNYIPYAGPALNIGLVSLVSALSFETLDQMWQAPVAMLFLNVIEGQFIQPLLIGKSFRINPGLVFISILFWGWLWGVLGVLIAVPMLMVIRSIINVYKQPASQPSDCTTPPPNG